MVLVRNAGYRKSAARRVRRAGTWLSWLAVTCVVLPACSAGVLAPHGPVGQAEKTILIDSLAIMLAIAVPTILATLAFAWWYRASNQRARHLPDWSFSGRIELVVWFIPTMVVILLAGVTWIGSHALDPAKPLAKAGAVEIQVVSLDWKWLFIYPQYGIASVNELEVPAGAPVHFALTSASVMNSFFVPELGSMIYTMNGMVTQLNLQADAPGTFRGISSHYSGEGFSDMHFQMRAVSAEGFSAWVEAARAAGPRLDEAAYVALMQQGTSAPMTFRSVDAHLFDRITEQAIAAGPGPATEHAGAAQAAIETR
jgi:cytochrome o ubiquinol oxidase subunit 2